MREIVMKRTWLAAIFTAVCIFPAWGQTAPAKGTEDECETLWKDFDQDDDDILSEAEAARLKAVLAIIDTNKDGLVGKDEFIAACRKGVLKGMNK
jgi:hypothetical protein